MTQTEVGATNIALIAALKASAALSALVYGIFMNEVPIGKDGACVIVQQMSGVDHRVQDVSCGVMLVYDVKASVPVADTLAADAILYQANLVLDSMAVNQSGYRLKVVRDGLSTRVVTEREKDYRQVSSRYHVHVVPMAS